MENKVNLKSDFVFDNNGKLVLKNGKETNPLGLTLRQHCIQVNIIEKWKQNNKLKVFLKKAKKTIIKKSARDETFIYRNIWCQSVEDYGARIEEKFLSTMEFVEKGGLQNFKFFTEKHLNFQLSIEEYFILLCFRINAIDNGGFYKILDNSDMHKEIYDNVSCTGARNFLQFSFGKQDENQIFPKTLEQFSKNVKKPQKSGLPTQQSIEQENGKYYYDESFLVFSTLLNLQKEEKIQNVIKSYEKGTFWCILRHNRVILPDRWGYKFISLSPYSTIMPYCEYKAMMELAKRRNCTTSIILNDLAKQSFKDWYVE